LFGAACCRRIWGRLTQTTSHEVLELVERFAEDEITVEELEKARQRHRSSGEWRVQRNAANAISKASFNDSRNTSALMSAIGAAETAAHALTDKPEGGTRSYKHHSWRPLWDSAREMQANLARDLFGNPFRPVSIQPAWLTPQVVSLATVAYEERSLPSGELDNARLAILADAVEDAGCTNTDILEHLRSSAGHVRGCWALDLILGKE
jgi:hypothetical protein